MTNHKNLNKIAKTTLALVLAGSFTFSASNAFADGDTTVNQTTGETNTSTVTSTTHLSTEKQEAPTLIPGDFFYFVKIVFEKIQLALTFNNVEEAKMLASNASERLKEADALFSKGEQDKAVKVMKDALEAMKEAEKKSDGQKETEQQADKKVEENQAVDEKVQTGEQTKEAPEATKEEDAVIEVKTEISHNIIALKAALEKVKNPVAKAALQKNIDKSYAKLEKKLAKKINHWAENEEQKDNDEQKKEAVKSDQTTSAAVTKIETTPSVDSSNKETTTTVDTNQATANDSVKQTTNVSVAPSKKQDEFKKIKQAEKAIRKEAHQEMKKKREELKELTKQKKTEQKGNGNGHGNGKEHVGKNHK